MTLILPDYVSTGYAGTVKDFKNTKVDRSGALRMEYFTATITTGTVTGKYVGLVPFNKGFKFAFSASNMYIENVGDGSFTFDLGILYYDSTLGTTAATAIASALTAGQAGGAIAFDEPTTGSVITTTADGWIVLKTGGSTTDNTGAIYGQIVGCYDTAG